MRLTKASESGLERYKRFLFLLIKLTIVVGAFYFIYNKLINNNTLDFAVFYQKLTKHQLLNPLNISIVIGFSIANWVLEFIKWKLLVRNFSPITLAKAAVQSLGSLTASLMTPNRIGEYGAKAIYFKKPLRKKILGLTLFGNLSQLLWTTNLGTIGLSYFIYIHKPELAYYKLTKALALLAAAGYLFFYLGRKVPFQFKGYSFKRLKDFTKQLSSQSKYGTIVLALLRYLVFSHQFYWLLLLFKVPVSYENAMALITSMYILSSILPSIFIFDVVIKGSIAVWLFSFEQANELTVLVITTTMWLFNFALPAILGSYFVLNFNVNFTNSDS